MAPLRTLQSPAYGSGPMGLDDVLYPAKTLASSVGGSACLVGTHLKALADGDPAIAFLGLDVMANPPVVMVNDHGIQRPIRFEREIEYVRLGAGMDLAATWASLRTHPGRRSSLAQVLGRSRRPPPASVEIGTEARRQLAYAAFIWSRAEVEVAVERSLRRLNDLRLRDRNGAVITDAAVNVLIVGSTAGGVGSATALPMAGLVKQVMERIGMPVHRSLFTYLAIGPSAFPPNEHRLSNSFETLRDVELSQRRGVVLCNA